MKYIIIMGKRVLAIDFFEPTGLSGYPTKFIIRLFRLPAAFATLVYWHDKKPRCIKKPTQVGRPFRRRYSAVFDEALA
jgi:hypothetical protein